MKCIAVPVHFTTRSLHAARYAAELAVKLDAELRLLFVNPLPVRQPLTPPVIEEIRHSGFESLRSLREQLQERAGGKLRIHTDQQNGKKEECIRAFCKEVKPFLVVVGGPIDLRLSCPVLSVPENAAFNGINSVVISCDRDDILSGMADHLPFLTELYARLGCRFELVHIIRNGEASISQAIREYREWKSRPVFFPEKLNFLRQDEPAEGISEYLRCHLADWLMVLPKTHSWIEFHDSQAKNISGTCKLPVLSVYE
ncbi:MAG TPA: universal stress protein [Puia sp.]|nr:universal stress protein [Puia sp.]